MTSTAVRTSPPASRAEPAAAPRYLNRELSWLSFNERVLALAEDADVPLLERTKFLAIFGLNLDEFFQVRVAGLRRQEAAGVPARSPDGLTPTEQLDAIHAVVTALSSRHARLFAHTLRPALLSAGIRLAVWAELGASEQKAMTGAFVDRIFPVLTPLAVDPGHPFPYISNLSLNLAVVLRDGAARRKLFARVKIPPVLPRFLATDDSWSVIVPLEEVIAANLDQLFPGMKVVEHHAFRVTRNSEVEIDGDDDDLLSALEDGLQRQRFSPAVRLEVEDGIPLHVLNLLMREMQVTEREVYRLPEPLGLAALFELHQLDRPDLKDRPFVPAVPAAFRAMDDGAPDVFTALRQRDVLVHHPYDSFSSSVEALLRQAAGDPDVLAIKQTLYRTNGESPIVEALTSAAEAGKQVVVLVEITARFDERNNIGWARTLEQAGCHVVYGLVGLKTHAKLCLVVRREGTRMARYVHIGTGNYNPTTARLYEDIGLFTNDPTLCADVSELFNSLTGYSRRSDYETIIVAPQNMRRRMLEMIEREAERSTSERLGSITMKLNGLTDTDIIDALYAASRRGVQIDLIVRGICALTPGVAGLSESIRVRSVLGRFLEHSRIYRFGDGVDEEIWIGSADLMSRNLDRRVETLVQVRDVELRERLRLILALAMADTTGTWTLAPDGSWSRTANGDPGVNLQEQLMRR